MFSCTTGLLQRYFFYSLGKKYQMLAKKIKLILAFFGSQQTIWSEGATKSQLKCQCRKKIQRNLNGTRLLSLSETISVECGTCNIQYFSPKQLPLNVFR